MPSVRPNALRRLNRKRFSLLTGILLAAGCTLQPTIDTPLASPTAPRLSKQLESRGQDIVIFALGLMETGYRFGGKNPEAGLDCSGMVSYVFRNAANITLKGSAADMAKRGRPVDRNTLQPGDLVFFNTLNRPRSHVGIYLGEGRFIHAPSTNGKVRTDSLVTGWYANRFEEGRTYLD